MNSVIPQNLIVECRRKLVTKKAEVLNRIRAIQLEFTQSQLSRSTSGDEIDQTVAQQEEHSFLISQDRMRSQLIEIEMALARIEDGKFGICEETEEKIETERLLAIPWTRLSIEGAELREAMQKRYAK